MSDSYDEMMREVERQQKECGPRKVYKQNSEIPEQEFGHFSDEISARLERNGPENDRTYFPNGNPADDVENPTEFLDTVNENVTEEQGNANNED